MKVFLNRAGEKYIDVKARHPGDSEIAFPHPDLVEVLSNVDDPVAPELEVKLIATLRTLRLNPESF